MKKFVKCGEDFLRDKNWKSIRATRLGVIRLGMKRMPKDLKALGFGVGVCETDEYFRISYGRKA